MTPEAVREAQKSSREARTLLRVLVRWHLIRKRIQALVLLAHNGILLCRYHHMTLHNGGWRITREGTRDFELHPPGGEPAIPLPARLIRRYLWGIDPPPKRFHPAA